MRVVLGLLCTAVLATAGCGGEEGDGEGFAQSATAICEETNAEIRGLGTPESYPETQLYARRAKDAVGDQIEALEELEPPAANEAAVDLYLETLRERERLLDGLTDAADANSMNDVRRVGSELAALGTTAREQATAAGIAACEPE